MHPATSRAKRALDVACASAALTVLGAPLAVVALVVRLRMGAPVLFRQVRPGLHGAPFELVKFRTMRSGPGSDAERLTPFGAWLRSTSIDELPELWNVLRGEMSVIGPRPLLMSYLDRYTPEQARRHEARPGLSGLAQVEGRNAVGWEERFALDVAYVDDWSVWLDLRLIARTLAQVVRRVGIADEGEATMRPFEGGAGGGYRLPGIPADPPARQLEDDDA